MSTDLCALCEELVDELEDWIVCDDEAEIVDVHALIDRARAALAEDPVGPTPIPVVERWPEFSDCDPQERVWAWNPVLGHWKLLRINRSVHTHWLPANALPVPADD